MPTEYRQLIGFAGIVWGCAVLASQGMTWINLAMNLGGSGVLIVLVVCFFMSLTGIIGGYMLIKKRNKGFSLIIPFCLSHLVVDTIRYTGAQHDQQSQLALYSAILALILLVASISSFTASKRAQATE